MALAQIDSAAEITHSGDFVAMTSFHSTCQYFGAFHSSIVRNVYTFTSLDFTFVCFTNTQTRLIRIIISQPHNRVFFMQLLAQ